MAGEWRECKLGDAIELKRGYDLPQQNRIPGHVPIVTSSGVSDYHASAMVKGPGVVTGRYGTLGQVYYISGDFWPHNTTLYVKDFKGNNPRFIRYFLQGIDFLAYSDKAAVPGLNRNHLHQASVRLPVDVAEQSAIAHILGTLDDKIELNRRMNETLEAIARAIFKSWFVDFDPVHAKAGGCDTGLDKTVANLFPAALEDSELGMIPKGWTVCRWGDLSTLEYGRGLQGYDNPAGPYTVFGTNGAIGTTTAPLCHHPTVVVGRKGAYRGIHFADKPCFVIDTAFFLEPVREFEMRWAYYELLAVDINAMDSGSAIPSTSREDFYALPVLYPPPECQHRFAELLRPLWSAQADREAQCRTLLAVRDALLPKLISGDVRIRDAARFIEGHS